MVHRMKKEYRLPRRVTRSCAQLSPDEWYEKKGGKATGGGPPHFRGAASRM